MAYHQPESDNLTDTKTTNVPTQIAVLFFFPVCFSLFCYVLLSCFLFFFSFSFWIFWANPDFLPVIAKTRLSTQTNQKVWKDDFVVTQKPKIWNHHNQTPYFKSNKYPLKNIICLKFNLIKRYSDDFCYLALVIIYYFFLNNNKNKIKIISAIFKVSALRSFE